MYTHANLSSLSRLLAPAPEDTAVLSKACLLNRLNIKSNYWKIPDTQKNLTALAADSRQDDAPLLAISSANADANLFIYEMDTELHFLTHHTTISLPNIHALAWVPNTDSKFLISGNSRGYAHLVTVPLGSDTECAEIVKRFNHRKHLRKKMTQGAGARTSISQLGFSGDNVLSVYDEALFQWDINDCASAVRPRPTLICEVPGIRSFSAGRGATVALAGEFGISLFDSRSGTHSVPPAARPDEAPAHKVQWHPNNEHVMATAHANGLVRLWDTRMEASFGELVGHRGQRVLAMEWHGNDLFTGGSDGNIVHWDMSSDLPDGDLPEHADKLLRCTLKEGVASVEFDLVSNAMVQRASERQCGTLLPALNSSIVGMCLVTHGDASDCSIISVDGSAFLGLHCKIYSAVNQTEDPYYNADELNLMRTLVPSDATLVETAPLDIAKRKPSVDNGELQSDAQSMVSVETLTDTESNASDFHFTPHTDYLAQRGPYWDLPESLELANLKDSVCSVSTIATIVEEGAVGKPHGLASLESELQCIWNVPW